MFYSFDQYKPFNLFLLYLFWSLVYQILERYLLLGSICLDFLFPSFHTKIVFIFDDEICFLEAEKNDSTFKSLC